VFAAASLSETLQEVGAAYGETVPGSPELRVKIKFSFAASSVLAKQIESGADAALFLSADEAWMDYLQTRNLLRTESRRSLLENQMVLVVPADQPQQVTISADGAWLAALPKGRIATGDPAHVPAGKYARQALTSLGLWGQVERRIASAENVRGALVLVERGEAVAGIVYKTDAAASKKVVVAGVFPALAHDPVSYPVALLRGHAQGDSGPGERDASEAGRFYAFLTSAAARAIFIKHGFIVR
jgi:molybdate transport system substrate-binding protein